MHLQSSNLICWLSITSIRGAAGITFENVEHTFDTLQTWYNSSTGLWMPSTGWWNSANCLTMIANLAAIDDKIKDRTKDLWQEVFNNAAEYNKQMTQAHGAFWRRKLPLELEYRDATDEDTANVGFLNGYYDDEGWWALAWIAVYDLTLDQKYLDKAVQVFDDMHNAWNTTPVGGVWWDRSNTYVNAISNELHFSVAAHLANRRPDQKPYYVDVALNSWLWIYGSGLINAQSNIEDGLWAKDETGLNLPKVWSYNQGVILTALTELDQALQQPLYTAMAKLIADAALANFTSMLDTHDPDYIIHESCEPTCDDTSSLFKGIFVRSLARLHAVAPEDRYGIVLMKNAESLWRNVDQWNRLGSVWDNTTVGAGASAQCAGMDLFVGALGTLGEWEGDGVYEDGKAHSQ